ncbi:MAG: alanine--tRNA ligase [Candidatus Edwardsbacteria bacterium]
MKSKELRQKFLDYFSKQGHTIVPSSSLLPEDDPTLLFTNAGMNQFKKIFLGLEKRNYQRATSVQKCIRAGGKHNDLEEVGRDGRHHTFFEMLGNWSFGDSEEPDGVGAGYYKKEVIEFAWEFLTKDLNLPKERLWATIFKDDNEAAKLWRKITGLPPERIRRFDETENFWEMGETGPCGPCSEVHYDQGEEFSCGKPDCTVNCGCDRFVEVWNLVFIQYNRRENGQLKELPAKHIDTGLGLERTTSIVQNVNSNYETDLFLPLLHQLEQIAGKDWDNPENIVSSRVIADHIRALTFSITDGIMPSNEGRGYVVRRILRRAARHGRQMGIRKPFLYQLTSGVVDIMGEAYPELKMKSEHVALVIKSEEERFNETLDLGLELFEKVAKKVVSLGKNIISGEEVFRLYDTYGFPLDLTQIMAKEKRLEIDIEGFERELNKQREKGRTKEKFIIEFRKTEPWQEISSGEHSKFIGYHTLEAEVNVRRFRQDEENKIEIILDQTPFYPAGGGQVSDEGVLQSDTVEIDIKEVERTEDGIIHSGIIKRGETPPLAGLRAAVEAKRRLAIAKHHTATHLLHNSLRRILGNHVQQQGSLVAPDRLRFDFTHFAPLAKEEREHIEELVNEKIRENLLVETFETEFDEAKKRGAIALFGEKYGKIVRVVKISDFSQELCGGTHLKATGEIGLFTIIKEEAIAAGVRRIEALAGEYAYQYFKNLLKERETLAEVLKTSPSEIIEKVSRLTETAHRLEKELAKFSHKSLQETVERLMEKVQKVDDFSLLVTQVECPEKLETLRKMTDLLRAKLKRGVAILGALVSENKMTFIIMVTEDLVSEGKLHAGKIAAQVAKIVGGSGGGKAHLAQAGTKDIKKIEVALREAPGIISQFIKK